MANYNFFAIFDVMKKHYKVEGLTHNEIAEYLSSEHNIVFKREAFAKAVETINDVFDDYEIVCRKGRYARYWLKQKHSLAPIEAELICALIADTDVLSRNEADNIIKKLSHHFSLGEFAESDIKKLQEKARSSKNEINGIDKLEDINKAINTGSSIRFKLIVQDKTVSDYCVKSPIEWVVSSGDVVVKFNDMTEAKLSKMLNLEICM